MAIGTSMPELIVSLIAALEGNTDIAIGNVLGSNIANVFLILGLTAIFSRSVIGPNRSTRVFDIPVVLATSLILLIFVSDQWLDSSPVNMIQRSE